MTMLRTGLVLLLAFGVGISSCQKRSVTVEGQQIPLRDGIILVADTFVPDAAGQYSTILEVTPYRRNSFNTYRYEYEHWNNNGFAFVVVDSRGQGDSQGEFQYFQNDTNDSYDILDWIAKQSWSNGRVAMRGSSYTGTNQWFAARSGSPYLYCITPSCNAETSPALESPAYHSGIFHFDWGLQWVSGLSDSGVDPAAPVDWDSLLLHRPMYTAEEVVYGKPMKLYKQFLDHETADSYWTNIEINEEEFRNITIPTMAFTGWFEGTLTGTINHYKGIRRYSPVPQNHFLVVGPWTHLNSPDGGYNFITGEPMLSVGDIALPASAVMPGLNLTTAFYKWCLNGEGSAPFQSQATIYLTGSNQWLNLPDYPPANVQVRSFYLSSTGRANGIKGDGKLMTTAPGDEPADEILHDPLDPFKNYIKDGSGAYVTLFDFLPIDISEFLDTNKTLVFVSEPLQEALTVLGNVQLQLHASTDALDADFHAILEDVAPDGSAIKLGPREAGLARARFRNRYAEETPVDPNVPFEIVVGLYEMGHTFLQGHRLRLSIMCSMYHRTFPNSGTGNSIAQNVDQPKIARNRIYHNALQPSALLLPVYNP